MASTSSSSHSTSNVENLPPHLIRLITKQMLQLHKQPPAEGVHVHLNHDDISDVQATIVGPEFTPYADGHFRIKLILPPDYPAQPPRGYFLTKIFHPNVAPANGEICVNALKRAADNSREPPLPARTGQGQGQSQTEQSSGSSMPAAGSLGHVMVVIKCLLINPNPESALNEDAGKLLLEDYEEFTKRARLMTQIHARAPVTASRPPAATKEDPGASSSSCSDNSSGSAEDPAASTNGGAKRQLAESNNSSGQAGSDLPSSSEAQAQSQSALNKKKKLKRL